jgi:hypothetical protein
MGTLFAMELKEVHPECGTHYELWVDHGVPFVYCPKCDKSWEPCDSAWAQYKAAYGTDPLSRKLGGVLASEVWLSAAEHFVTPPPATQFLGE